MAKRRINPSAGDILGRIGDLVYYRRLGKPCVRRTPIREKQFTAAEEKNQSRFGLASKFASSVLSDPVQRARYEQAAAGTTASAQNVAVSDFMHFPVLAEIDLSGYTGRAGELIRIRAEEGTIGAARVHVAIADRAKTIVEEGTALVENDRLTWWFVATLDLPWDQALWITITANDQPGNRTTKTLRHTSGSKPAE